MKAIGESKYNAVKILIESKTPSKEITQYFHISYETVTLIRESRTYDEYKQAVAEIVTERASPKKQPEQKTVPAPVGQVQHVVQVQATHYMMEELKAQTEFLKIISAKLAFIVDDLVGIKSPKEEEMNR